MERKYLFHEKNVERMLENQRKQTKTNLRDKLVGTAIFASVNLIIISGLLYGIGTYHQTPEYQAGLKNKTNYERIAAEADSLHNPLNNK